MGKISDGYTKTILKNLGIIITLFYVTFYLLCLITLSGFKVNVKHVGMGPFDWKHCGFSDGRDIAGWLSLVLNFGVFGSFLVFFVARCSSRSWDYVITLGILHWILTMIVSRSFPTNWIWWVSLIVAVIISTVLAEISSFCIWDMRDIKVHHSDNV